jgi:hypothetical protein
VIVCSSIRTGAVVVATARSYGELLRSRPRAAAEDRSR